jgi:hypothetical protein
LGQLLTADALGDGGTPGCDGVELAEVVADPLVGDFRQHELLRVGDGDLEVGRLGHARRIGAERQQRADLGPDEMIVEPFRDPTLADFVQPVFGVEARNRLAIAGAGQRERDVVARLHGARDIDQRTLPPTLGVDGIVDLLPLATLGSSARRPP